MSALIDASEFSSSSLARASGFTLHSVQMSAANLAPIPWMYWSAKRIFFLSGTSIPAIRGTLSYLFDWLFDGPLTLDLLVLRVGLADDADLALAPHHLARAADPLDTRLDLHADTQPFRKPGLATSGRDFKLQPCPTVNRAGIVDP